MANSAIQTYTYSVGSIPASTTVGNVSSVTSGIVAVDFRSGRVSVDHAPPVTDRLVAAFKDLAQSVLELEALLRG